MADDEQRHITTLHRIYLKMVNGEPLSVDDGWVLWYARGRDKRDVVEREAAYRQAQRETEPPF